MTQPKREPDTPKPSQALEIKHYFYYLALTGNIFSKKLTTDIDGPSQNEHTVKNLRFKITQTFQPKI